MSTQIPSDEHSKTQQVILVSHELIPEPHEIVDCEIEPISNIEIPDMYELPSRSTRGVPTKRYGSEFEAQRSRYPV